MNSCLCFFAFGKNKMSLFRQTQKLFSVFKEQSRQTRGRKASYRVPLAVNCTDRIRFNAALDFLSPPKKGKK